MPYGQASPYGWVHWSGVSLYIGRQISGHHLSDLSLSVYVCLSVLLSPFPVIDMYSSNWWVRKILFELCYIDYIIDYIIGCIIGRIRLMLADAHYAHYKKESNPSPKSYNAIYNRLYYLNYFWLKIVKDISGSIDVLAKIFPDPLTF